MDSVDLVIRVREPAQKGSMAVEEETNRNGRFFFTSITLPSFTLVPTFCMLQTIHFFAFYPAGLFIRRLLPPCELSQFLLPLSLKVATFVRVQRCKQFALLYHCVTNELL
jgi:hypothetical protein